VCCRNRQLHVLTKIDQVSQRYDPRGSIFYFNFFPISKQTISKFKSSTLKINPLVKSLCTSHSDRTIIQFQNCSNNFHRNVGTSVELEIHHWGELHKISITLLVLKKLAEQAREKVLGCMTSGIRGLKRKCCNLELLLIGSKCVAPIEIAIADWMVIFLLQTRVVTWFITHSFVGPHITFRLSHLGLQLLLHIISHHLKNI